MKKMIIAHAAMLCSLIMSGCADEEGSKYSSDVTVAGTVTIDMVDSNASTNTKTLFDNLLVTRNTGVILGQQKAYFEDDEYNDECNISKSTGKYPMLTGQDLQIVTNDNNDPTNPNNWQYQRTQAYIEWIKECYAKGVFTTMSWHFQEPYEGTDFYTKNLTDEVAAKAFKSILEDGENHEYYKGKLDILADFFASLVDENGELIPIIFRPFHEMRGSWFWWGLPYSTAEEYIQNWQFTVEYLRDVKGVHNLIYAFSPDRNFIKESEYLECYPGDDYVDILGFDSYVDYGAEGEYAINETITQLKIVSTLARERFKIAAHTEFGYDIISNDYIENVYTDIFIRTLNESEANIAYMLFWEDKTDVGFTPTESDTEALRNDFKEFVTSDEILMVGDIDSPCIK